MNSLLMRQVFALVVAGVGAMGPARAHPASGIVVDRDGRVFFQDAVARTIWKIDASGRLSAHVDTIGGHWMALDNAARLKVLDETLVERVPTAGSAQLIVADGGAPVTLGSDGNIYYGLDVTNSDLVKVGLTKISGIGTRTRFAPKLASAISDLGITGICTGPDGALYLACLTAVLRVTADETVSTVVNQVRVEKNQLIEPTVFLRGIDVGTDGAIYLAAAGARCVLKIAPGNSAIRLLQAEPPWTPTGVAVHGGDLYVLEVTNAERNMTEGWLPRVRKRSRDGLIMTLATITAAHQNAQPNRQKLP